MQSIKVMLVAVLALLMLPFVSATAQTFAVLHNFTGGNDGGGPEAGLTLDRGGNLYGTTTLGGTGYGTVFRLRNYGASWVLTTLHPFTFSEGIYPESRLVFGPDGALYGTTKWGGGNGTAFRLSPPVTICRSISCPWPLTVLHTFGSGTDASQPNQGDLVFDSSGNIYGATRIGGSYSTGAVYELTKTGDMWSEQVLYSFSDMGLGGAFPLGGVTFDRAGNLYGTNSAYGSQGGGVVYQLVRSGQAWTENVLHSFTRGFDGETPSATLTADPAGNFYGPTLGGGDSEATIFKLTDSLMFNIIYSFSSQSNPFAALAIDPSGALYGTTLQGGNMQGICAPYGCGTVFKLVPTIGGWEYVDLHDFVGTDGWYPNGAVILDANGNLYGTTIMGGSANNGVVWKLTQ